MASGDEDSAPEEGKVLSPEELDIADDDHVEQIGEGRYVVSPEVRRGSVAGTSDTGPASEPTPASPPEQSDEAPDLGDAAVHEWLRTDMGRRGSRYGFDVTAKFGSHVSQQQLVSNDIVTVFESLMLWYARQVDNDTPIEQVLGILLSESNVPVRYPAESLEALVDSTPLDRDDEIGDLVDALAERDGVQL